MSVAPSWEKIVLGGTVVTMEDGRDPIANGAIAIADGKIAETWVTWDNLAAFQQLGLDLSQL